MRNEFIAAGDYARVNIYRANGTGNSFLIDVQDLEAVMQATTASWYPFDHKNGMIYARASVNGKRVMLHRFLLNAPAWMHVVHLNGNGLDCRRENLLLVSAFCDTEQAIKDELARRNPPKPEEEHPTSDVRGVSFHKASKRWNVSLFWEGKRYSLGYYDEKERAEEVARAFVKEKGLPERKKRDFSALERGRR